jgi:hypothetical protein
MNFHPQNGKDYYDHVIRQVSAKARLQQFPSGHKMYETHSSFPSNRTSVNLFLEEWKTQLLRDEGLVPPPLTVKEWTEEMRIFLSKIEEAGEDGDV